MEHEDSMDFATIRTIFIDCDVDKTDQVPVSKLIDYIKPFFMDKQKALEDLRHSLDPDGENVLLNSNDFYEVMCTWCQKVCSSTESFGKSPNNSSLLKDDKVHLPISHSTPRPSLGNRISQHSDFDNLSIGSANGLSTSKLNDTDKIEKNVLEEHIREIEHSLRKTNGELLTTKQLLITLEEQHEALQKDFERQNIRLKAEQQVNQHLQKQNENSDEMRDIKLKNCQRQMEDLKRKLNQTKEDANYNKIQLEELEQEKTNLEKKILLLTKQNQECTKYLIDLKDELEAQKTMVIAGNQNYEELRLKFAQKNDIIDELKEEVKHLRQEKVTLENRVSIQDEPSGEVPLLRDIIAADSVTKNYFLILREKNERIFTLEEELEKQKNECNQLKQGKSVQIKKTQPKIDGQVQTCNADWCEMVALEEEINDLKKRLENSSYESKVKELSDLCTTLSCQKNELELNFATLKSEYEDAVVKRDNLHKLVDQIQEHIDQKNKLIEELRELNKEISRSLNTAQEDLKNKVNLILTMRNKQAEDIEIKNRLWENNKVLHNEVAHLTLSNTNLSDEHNNLLELVKNSKIEYNNLLMVLDKETEVNVKLNKHNNQLIEESNGLLAKINEAAVLSASLKDKVRQKEEEMDKLRVEREKMEEELSEIRMEVRKQLVEDKNDAVAILNETLSTSVKELEDKMGQKDEQIGKLQLEEEKLHQQLSESRMEVAQLKEKLQHYQKSPENKNMADCYGNKKSKSAPRRTFARQEALLEKQQLKIDNLEGKLNGQKATISNLRQELEKLQTLLSEKEIKISELRGELKTTCDQLNQNMLKKNCNGNTREPKSVNKFTICSAKFQTGLPNCTIPPNEKSIEHVPSLILSHTADLVIEELGLNKEKKHPLTKEETESKVTYLVLQLLISSEDVADRLQSYADNYKSKYEQVLGLLGDISHRLRDHVCIGTAEPIKPVFVLLEEVKLQLAELVQCAGAMGGLVYEDKMKCCWKLASDYMATLREENEALLRISRETTSTQTGTAKHGTKAIEGKCQRQEDPPSNKRSRCSTLKLFLITFSTVVVLALGFVIHIMATCEERHCPFDGLINAINFGLPPM